MNKEQEVMEELQKYNSEINDCCSKIIDVMGKVPVTDACKFSFYLTILGRLACSLFKTKLDNKNERISAAKYFTESIMSSFTD